MKKIKFSVLAILFLAIIQCQPTANKNFADTIYINGNILTMVGEVPEYIEGLAVKNGEIIMAGDSVAVMAMVGPNTFVYNLMGKTLMPGFIDGHSHYFSSLIVDNQCNLSPQSGAITNVDSILAILQRFKREQKIEKDAMVMAYGYVGDGILLNRYVLDKAFPENPVRIDHVSTHGGILNSAARTYYNIGESEPNGLIMEVAWKPVFEFPDKMDDKTAIHFSRVGQMKYAQEGITTAQEGSTKYAQLQILKRASDSVHIIDVVAYPFITEVGTISKEFPVSDWLQYKNGLKIGGVKITVDGSPQGKTACFTTAYSPDKNFPENWKGELTYNSQDTINNWVKRVYDMDVRGAHVPLNLHCNGDGAIDALITAYKLASNSNTAQNWNVTCIHSQFIRKNQLDDFIKLNIRPSFFTLHTYYFNSMHEANRGKIQAHYISPMRDAIDKKMKPTNHTDFPVVSLNQMMVVWSAVNRLSLNDSVIGANQRISAYESLQTITVNAAEQYNESESKGTLEVNKRADLVILDKNPLSIDAKEIKDIIVLETIKDGKTIYQHPLK